MFFKIGNQIWEKGKPTDTTPGKPTDTTPSKKGNQISEKPTDTTPELPKPHLLRYDFRRQIDFFFVFLKK